MFPNRFKLSLSLLLDQEREVH